MLALVLFFVLSHFFSFICSILEAVLLSCTDAYVALLKKKGSSAGNILENLKVRIDQPLSAILTVNTISHTIGAAGIGASVVEVFGSKALAVGSIIVTLTMLYWTEMLPKTIGALHWKKLAPYCAHPIRWLIVLTYPFVISFNLIFRFLSRGKQFERITEEDILMALEAGTKEGILQEAEQNMVENIFRLGDRQVGMLMRPRVDVEWFDLQEPIEEICKQILASQHQRFPVCRSDMDGVVGILFGRELLSAVWDKKTIELEKILTPPLFVYENQRIFELITLFRKNRENYALVTDEYGTIQGVITLDDILQAVVKDIEGEEKQVIKINNRSWIVSGHIPIDELKEIFHFERLPKEERGRYRTLSGLCMHELGTIPRKGEGFTIGTFRFEILSVRKKRVEKVLLTKEEAALKGNV